MQCTGAAREAMEKARAVSMYLWALGREGLGAVHFKLLRRGPRPQERFQ